MIFDHFQREDCPTVGDISFFRYSEGIKLTNGIFENGLYIFRFKESFYVGKATSCTILERLSKHFDSRRSGGFNGLLRKLHPIDNDTHTFEVNQNIMKQSKILLIPIDSNLLITNNAKLTTKNCIDLLEMDLIIKLRELFSCSELNTKKKSELSGFYFYS